MLQLILGGKAGVGVRGLNEHVQRPWDRSVAEVPARTSVVPLTGALGERATVALQAYVPWDGCSKDAGNHRRTWAMKHFHLTMFIALQDWLINSFSDCEHGLMLCRQRGRDASLSLPEVIREDRGKLLVILIKFSLAHMPDSNSNSFQESECMNTPSF